MSYPPPFSLAWSPDTALVKEVIQINDEKTRGTEIEKVIILHTKRGNASDYSTPLLRQLKQT